MDNKRGIFFGDLFRTFRKRRKLGQYQLAEVLGVHRNTIGNWESGKYLPKSKTIVLEVASQLRLNQQETRQLLEASLTMLSSCWYLPYPRNPFFTGCEDFLDTLHQMLCTEQTVVLHGLGGIGKTQIALEYAYRHALEYSAVLWIEAGTAENIMSSLLHIAEYLQLPERWEADQQRVVVAVQNWLRTYSHWLLIWDNLEDLDLLYRFLPSTHWSVQLLTTQYQKLQMQAASLELLSMGQEEGMLLVLRRAKLLGHLVTSEDLHRLAQQLPTEYAAAVELVQTMGGLPLALDQAGAYIEETGCGVAGYLQRFEQQRAHLLDRRGMAGGGVVLQKES